MALKMYAGYYTRCEHCGIYDRDPDWCVLCGKHKEAARRAASGTGVEVRQATGAEPVRARSGAREPAAK